MVLTFDTRAVQEAEEDFKKIDLTPRRREIINAAAAMYEGKLGISTIAIKGFISIAIRDWQQTYKIKLEDIDDLPAEEKLMHHKKIGEQFFGRLSRIIPKEQIPTLQKIFADASEQASKMSLNK